MNPDKPKETLSLSISVYNLSSSNGFLGLIGLGGVYHTGIVLGSREFCFSFAEPGQSGIYTSEIGKVTAGGAIFRETLDAGVIELSLIECEQVLFKIWYN